MVKLIKIFIGLTFIYFASASLVLYFFLPQLLFPIQSTSVVNTPVVNIWHQPIRDNDVLIRQLSEGNEGCLIFFPGQHGGVDKYYSRLLRYFADTNISVFTLSYSGQNDAIGRVNELDTLIKSIALQLKAIRTHCVDVPMYYYGRSLGAMIAAKVQAIVKPDVLLLESAPKSLALSIERFLGLRWFLTPLTILPIKYIVPFRENLFELLSQSHVPAFIFQGSNDRQTPIDDLEHERPEHVTLFEVLDATHSDTYQRAVNDIIDTIQQYK